jgi:hypothetical protein
LRRLACAPPRFASASAMSVSSCLADFAAMLQPRISRPVTRFSE